MRLHSHSWGDPAGGPVVCVHGVTGHGERFRRLAEERLAERRVVAVDLRGHGRSGPEPPWNIETHVADLVETASALRIERADWVGFSFGGRLVAELALVHPGLVDRVVLLDPALQLPPADALEAAEDERADETWASADDWIEARLASGDLISAPRSYLEEEARQHLVPVAGGRLRQRYSRPAVIAAWGEMARPAPAVAEVPTRLVVGSESRVPNEPGRYADRLELYSGHSLLWDAFEETADAVAGFLA